MTDWIKWDGGECPIPDAKAGEYEAVFEEDEFRNDCSELCRTMKADDLNWHSPLLLKYRLLEKKPSDLDWLEGLIQVEFDHQNAKQPNFSSVAAREAYRTVLDLIKDRKEAKS